MSEEQLIQGLRNRDAEAFRQIVQLHQDQVINICYRFVHDRSEAEDLAQETFIEVFNSIEHFRGEASLATWIHRIAVSKSLDYLRRQGRKKRGSGLRSFLGLKGELTELPAPRSDEPDRRMEQAERRRVLRQALAQLPDKQRIAFVLSQYDGISYQEIATILKTSLPSVESLIHRARKNLQKTLRHFYESQKP